MGRAHRVPHARASVIGACVNRFVTSKPTRWSRDDVRSSFTVSTKETESFTHNSLVRQGHSLCSHLGSTVLYVLESGVVKG